MAGASLTSEQITEIVKAIADGKDIGEAPQIQVEDFLKEIKYQGLSLQAVFGQAVKAYRTNNPTEKDIEPAMKEIILAGLIFLARGSNIDNITRKSSDAGKNIIRRIIKNLNIQTTGRQTLSGDTVTLPRLAICAVRPLAQIFSNHHQTMEYPLKGKVDTDVAYLGFPLLGHIIPDDEEYDILFVAAMASSFELDRIVNSRKVAGNDATTRFESVVGYGAIARSATFFTTKQKTAALDYFGILDTNQKIKKTEKEKLKKYLNANSNYNTYAPQKLKDMVKTP